jgi:hypothetical protein
MVWRAGGKMTGLAKRHDLSDWLTLHGLDPPLCRRLLTAAAGHIGGEPTGPGEFTSEECAVHPNAAWLQAVEAMCALFPMARSTIELTFHKTSRILAKGTKTGQRAVTLNDGGNGYPLVLYTYRGEISDSMVIAHEFSHALQIIAGRGQFVAPVIRELCAFVGEIALISHLRTVGDDHLPRLQQVWARDNFKYFRVDREELESVLSRPGSVYRYNWNYPIARHLSIEISQKLAREHVWAIFEGKVPMQRLCSQLGC